MDYFSRVKKVFYNKLTESYTFPTPCAIYFGKRRITSLISWPKTGFHLNMFPLATQMLDGRPNFLCSGFSCFQKTFKSLFKKTTKKKKSKMYYLCL